MDSGLMSSRAVASGPTRRPGPLARLLTRVIGWYQVARKGRVSPCRFVPSCSTYALDAVTDHGAVRGSALAARRLLRCHPWGGHGYDPVPPPPAAHERVDQRV